MRFGSNTEDRRVSASFRRHTTNGGNLIAGLVSLDGPEAIFLLCLWPGKLPTPRRAEMVGSTGCRDHAENPNYFFP